MKKAGFLAILFVVLLLAVAVIAEAQQPTKVPRLGFIGSQTRASAQYQVDGFRQGLRDCGMKLLNHLTVRWIEG
jgi:hypothetical protein